MNILTIAVLAYFAIGVAVLLYLVIRYQSSLREDFRRGEWWVDLIAFPLVILLWPGHFYFVYRDRKRG